MRPVPRFRIISDPEAPAFKIDADDFLVGRSPKQCRFVITGDTTVSRAHARVFFENGRYIIENLGQNPTTVNNKPVERHVLRDGDTVAMGKTVLKFLAGAEITPADIPEQGPEDAEKTVFLESPAEKVKTGPRLVFDDGSGKIESLPLNRAELVIGRSSDSDFRLDDSSVSRRHLMIARRNEEYFAVNLSETYPLFVNDAKIGAKEKRIYSGDRIGVGGDVFTFISDRPEDAPPPETKIVTKMKGAGWAVWAVATALLLVVAGYALYSYAYLPWRENKTMQAVSALVESGDNEKARGEIVELLNGQLSPEARQTARELLSKTSLALATALENKGAADEAKAFLRKHLRNYGAWEDSKPLWAKLDSLHLNTGRYMESEQKFQEALNEYAAIGEDSIYFEPAQKRMKLIWMEFQKERLQDNTVAELLEKAEKSFIEKKYLTPVDENAYSAYRAILEIDMNHRLALQRIEQMKEFYGFHGDKHLKSGNLSGALIYFERYGVIDPDDAETQEKIRDIRKRLQKVKTAKATVQQPKPERQPKPGQQPEPARQAEPEKQPTVFPDESSAGKDDVKTILQESGKENTWIMKYLFEDKEGEKDSETPW